MDYVDYAQLKSKINQDHPNEPGSEYLVEVKPDGSYVVIKKGFNSTDRNDLRLLGKGRLILWIGPNEPVIEVD